MKNKTTGFFAEFKKFISRGNVLDMAVGMIVGSAFTGIVNSLVNNILMPALGYLIGGLDFADMKIVLSAATDDKAEVAISYGLFINQIINFLLISLAIFCLIKAINTARERLEQLHKSEPEPEPVSEPEPAPEPSDELKTLYEIRDLLKAQAENR